MKINRFSREMFGRNPSFSPYQLLSPAGVPFFLIFIFITINTNLYYEQI
jgi:hypothetical protein